MAITRNSINTSPAPNLQGICRMLTWEVFATVDAGPVQVTAKSPDPLFGIVRRIQVNEITLQGGGTIVITEDDDILTTKAQILNFTAGADKDINFMVTAEDNTGSVIASAYTHQVVGSYLTLVTTGLVAANSFQMRLFLEF